VAPLALNSPCWAARDCGSGAFCNPTNQRCTPAGNGVIGAPCLADAECTSGLRCNYTGFTGYCSTTGSATRTEGCTDQDDCTAGLYCGAARECLIYREAFPDWAGVNCATDTGAFHSYFEVPRTSTSTSIPDFFRLPFPNDARVKDGQLDISDFPKPGPTPLGPDLVKLYTDALVADFDGFSPMIGINFRFSKDIDFGHLAGNALSSIRFADLSETPVSHVGGMGFGYAAERNDFACHNMLTVYAQIYDVPLKAGHTYTVVLTNGAIRSATGEMPEQDADLAAVLGPTRPSNEDLGRAWDAYAKLRAYLAAENVPAASVANATVFTIADPKADMGRVRDALAMEPAPTLSGLFQCGVSAGADPCDDGSDARKCGSEDPDFIEVHGKISMPIYQTGTQPYERPADGGGLNIVNGRAVKVRNEEVCFALSLPKGTAPGPGWPLMVYSHGTGGSFRSFISDGVASAMAKATPKVAVFSFDNVGHGARRGASTKKPEELVFNVLNPRAARDNFAQGAADLMTAFRLPSSPAPAGWTGPTLKFTSSVVFFGHSQGATHGSLALPFTDAAPAAIFSGAGASLTQSLLNKTNPVNVTQGIEFLLREPLDSGHPMLTIWQSFFDRSDPINFNRSISNAPLAGRTAKHLYMSWGSGDTYSPPITLKLNAITLGVSPVNPFNPNDLGEMPGAVGRPVSLNMTVPGGSKTGVVIQYDPPSGTDGHFVATRNTSAVRDWTAFVTTFLTGTPTIPQ
jgi:hypothetical protein